MTQLATTHTFRELTLTAMPDASEADPQTLHQVLPTYYEVPRGCGVHTMLDDRMEPLMHRGDMAVIDFNDRDLVPGELYLLLNGNGPQLWQIVYEPKTNRERMGRARGDCVWMHPLNRPRSKAECDRWVRERRPLRTSDGPLKTEALPETMLGKAIGFYCNPREAAKYGRGPWAQSA